MCNLFNKTRRSFFLSNIFRNIFYFIIIYFAFVLPLHSQWLDAYIPDFKVNDDNLNSYQTNSVIGVDTAGNFVIAWNDVRVKPGGQNPTQIYCQRYNKDGLALGSNFRIGQDTAFFPKLSVLRDGRFIVSWIRLQGGLDLYELYFQRFDKNGTSLNQPTRVIDTAYYYSLVQLSGSSISSDTSGIFIICWSKSHTFSSKKIIYFQRYDSSGVRLGGIDSVNEVNSNAEFPSIAMNNDGSFVAAWQDDRTAQYDIYMQRYNQNGNKIGNNVKVNDIPGLNYTGGAKVCTDGKGRIAVVWSDPRICNLGDVYYQLYDSNGTAVNINRKANTSDCNVGTGVTSVKMRSDKKFYILWTDVNFTGREQTYGRRFDVSGNPIGNQYMIPASSPPPTQQRADALALLGDKVYSTWTHFIQGNNNTDIWCNVRGFQNPDTVIGIINSSIIENEFKLYNAYPNPFNPVTIIKYDLPKDDDVFISIYDITGKTIKQFNTRKQNKGTYEISITNELYSSGIYFLKIQTASGFNAVQKLVLLK